MINTINFQNLRLGEAIQYLTNVNTICADSDPVTLKINERHDALVAATQNLSSAFKREQGSDITQDIELTDKRRDDAIICLSLLSKGYMKHFDAGKQEAAVLISNKISKYGNAIARMNYQEETATLNNLVTELESNAECSAAVVLLGFGELLAELKEANAIFDQLYLSRVKEAAETVSESTEVLRKKANEAYLELVKLIKALAVVSGEAAYLPLAQQINALIEKYNAVVEARKNSPEGEAELEVELEEIAE